MMDLMKFDNMYLGAVRLAEGIRSRGIGRAGVGVGIGGGLLGSTFVGDLSRTM
jgi:hypothetical protein